MSGTSPRQGSNKIPASEAMNQNNNQALDANPNGRKNGKPGIEMIPIQTNGQSGPFSSQNHEGGEGSPIGGQSTARKFFPDGEDGDKKGNQIDAAKPETDFKGELKEKLRLAKQKGKEKEAEILRQHYGVFYYHQSEEEYDKNGPIMFSKSSLFCLSDQNKCRQAFAWLALWPGFDTFITIVILLNSLMLASTDYKIRLDPTYESEWTPIQEQIDLGFSIIFIIEFLVKVIAMGFLLSRKSYLFEAWNCLDFFIVCISIIGFLPIGGGSSGLKALRTFRILRPLRSVNKMPNIKKQITSLLNSIPGLMRVFFFIIFIFCIFAIFGVNQFLGQQYQFCRASEEGVFEDGVFVRWPKSGEEDGDLSLCSTDEQCREYYPDDEVAICGAVFDKYGVDPLDYDDIRNIELIMYGIPSFDNVFWGFLTIFQILTLESWVYLMYNFSDAGSPTISVIFFVMVVLLGAFFTMNLVLAIIVDAFDAAQETNAPEEDPDELERQKEELSRSFSKSMEKGKDIRNQDENPFGNVNQVQPGLLPDIQDNRQKGAAALGFDQQTIPTHQDLEEKKQEANIGGDLSGIQENRNIVENKASVIRDVEVIEGQKVAPMTDDQGKRDDGQDYLDEEQHDKDARLRAEDNAMLQCLFNFVTSVSFNFFIFVLIIGNTATLASYHFDQSDLQTRVLELFNEFFTWTFFLEMILKIIGLGFRNYRQDKYNVFDAVIVIISLVDWTISKIPNLDAGSALNAFRALRLLRMLKLSKSWKALADILRKTAKSMQEILSFSVLLFLFMYIFALLGMELFANGALVDADDNLIMGQENIQALYESGEFYTFPRGNFNNVGTALTSIFIVIIGEDWNWSMYEWVRAYGYGSKISELIAVFFFLLLMIMGNIVLFSLFTAVLLKNFEGGDEEEEEEEEEDTDKQEQTFMQKMRDPVFWEGMSDGFKEAFGKKIRVPKLLNAQGDVIDMGDEKQHQLEMERNARLRDLDSAASVLESEASVQQSQMQLDEEKRREKRAEKEKQKQLARKKRNNMRKVESLMHYDLDRTMAQRTSTITAPVEEKKLKPLMGTSLFCLGKDNGCRNAIYRFVENKWFGHIILILIVISTITLAFETPLDDPLGQKIKILGYIDLFMTVVFTFEALVKIIAWGFAFAGSDSYIREPWNILDFVIVLSALLGVIAGDSIKISFIKALRILKVLRPLRLIAKNKGLKIAIVSLGRSIPNIVRLQVIVLFFVFLFAILQTTILSGQLFRCSTDHLDLSMLQQQKYIVTMYDCINYGGEWVEPDLNFDTTLTSMLTLITIQTTEGWIDVLWDSVDAVGPYMQPRENNSPFMVVYTMMLIIIICMLFMELFVGVVIETFNNQKEVMAGNRDLERTQRSFIEVQMMAIKIKPKRRLEAEYSKLRNSMIHLSEHKNFDLFIMICILGNTVVLGFNWYMQPQSYKDVLEIFNYSFMIIFTVEAIIKLIAQRGQYFSDSWNIFDFTVVVGTIIILGITWAGLAGGLEILGTILRTLRIGRVFRLIKKQQKLQEIFKTLIDATPAMASLGLLLMLLIFMFAIIGMSQFALIGLENAGQMNRHVNFQTFGASFLTLVRCSTGEAWNTIMFDSSQSFSIMNQCSQNENYENIVADGRDPTSWQGPAGCGSGVAIGFHLLFQVIVSQVFLNLFIAIIIDAFFGQTDLANMPVQPKSIEDYQRVWAMYDKDGTGYIPVEKLDALLVTLSECEPDEGGALIPFKSRMQDKKFRNRQIIFLGIPTYENMKKVMFYDVLMKLCFQAVKLFYQQDEVKNMQRQLRVLRKIGACALNDDTLEVVHSQFTKRNNFDIEFSALQRKMLDPNPRAELIVELIAENKKLRKKYNHEVDTNMKVMGNEDVQKLGENDQPPEVSLYTTTHLGSALQIHDFIVEYLQKRPNRDGQDSREASRIGNLNSVPEVSSHQEGTKDQRNDNTENVPAPVLVPALPTGSGQPLSGSIEQEPADDNNDYSQVPDQDWRNLR